MTYFNLVFSFCIIFCLNIQLLRAELSVVSLPSFDSVLLVKLEAELFPDNPEWIPIEDYECHSEHFFKLDTQIMVRKRQPDSKSIQQKLKEIALTKNYSYFSPLMDLYEKYQIGFMKEWDAIVRIPYYDCLEKYKQVEIMFAFENALQALDWEYKQLTNEELWGNYLWQMSLYQNIANDLSGYMRYTDSFPFYSDYFRNIKRMNYSWFAYSTTFTAFTPHLSRIEQYIIEDVIKFNPQLLWKQGSGDIEKKEAWVFLYHMGTMTTAANRNFEKVLMEKYPEFLFRGHVREIHSYILRNEEVSPDFVRFVLDQIFTQDFFLQMENSDKDGWIRNMKNTHSTPIIREHLIEKVNSNKSQVREMALAFLINFPEKKVLDLFILKLKSKNSTKTENAILLHNLSRFNDNQYFKEDELDRISSALKTLPK